MTKDSVTVAVDAVVYYKIYDPLAATCNVENFGKSTKLLASTTLRTALGTKILSEILSDREAIANDVLESLDLSTNPWGIRVIILHEANDSYGQIQLHSTGLAWKNVAYPIEILLVAKFQPIQRHLKCLKWTSYNFVLINR